MTLYDIFRYTKEERIEIENLINIVFKLDIQDKVQEAFFQFAPKLIFDKKDFIPGFGEHEKWFNFHKHFIETEILVNLIEKTVEDTYSQDGLIDEVIDNEKYFDFIDDSLYNLSEDEIIEKFIDYLKQYH